MKKIIKGLVLVSGGIAGLCYLAVWIGMLMQPGVLEGMIYLLLISGGCLLFIRSIKRKTITH